MGDVFDAMNRARREEGGQKPESSDPAAEGGPTPPPGAEAPALPMEEAVRQSAAVELAAPPDPDAAPPTPAGGPTANGYSAELIAHHDPGSAITEQYRAIRTQILARGRNKKIQITAVTSAVPNEGKSVTTINLGMTFSELRNQRTLLVECDLRRPTFPRLLNREADMGLGDLLRGDVEQVEAVTYPTVHDNLQLIPAGSTSSVNSTELLSSPRMAQLLERCRERYDHVFIDTPPVLQLTDASIVGSMSDQMILVVRLNKTPSDVIERSMRLLRAANCEVGGVVLTHQSYATPPYIYRYSRYGYGYGYGYGYRY